MHNPEFQLLTRDGCGLCEEFEHALRGRYPQIRLRLEDVNSREDWRRRYGLRIPVLLDEWNEVVAEGHLDEDAVLPGLSTSQPAA